MRAIDHRRLAGRIGEADAVACGIVPILVEPRECEIIAVVAGAAIDLQAAARPLMAIAIGGVPQGRDDMSCSSACFKITLATMVWPCMSIPGAPPRIVDAGQLQTRQCDPASRSAHLSWNWAARH